MAGPTMIDWGDGSAPETGPEKGDISHKYTTDGDYTIAVSDQDDPSKKTTVDVTIPIGGVVTPKADVVTDSSDPTGRTAKLTYSGFTGTVSVTWGDSTPAETGQPAVGTLLHAYAAEVVGEQTITVASETDPSRKATAKFTPVPIPPDPSMTAKADTEDETGRTVVITLIDFPADSAVKVDWDDGSQVEEIPIGTTTGKHAYGAEVTSERTIKATSAKDAKKTATAKFTPKPIPPKPSMTATADSEDETGRTVLVKLSDFPTSSAVKVDWGDGTAVGEIPAGTTTGKHAYGAEVVGEQTIKATSAGDSKLSATAKFTPKPITPKPSMKATPDPEDKTGRTVLVTFSDFPTSSTVKVDWGDGTTVEEIPAGTTTGKHAYSAEVVGEQTIKATSTKDAKLSATAKFTPKQVSSEETDTVTRKEKKN